MVDATAACIKDISVTNYHKLFKGIFRDLLHTLYVHVHVECPLSILFCLKVQSFLHNCINYDEILLSFTEWYLALATSKSGLKIDCGIQQFNLHSVLWSNEKHIQI